MPDGPDHAGKKESEQDAEERPRDRHDDFIERGNLRQRSAILVGLALDHVHRSELRQFHEPAERKGAQRVLDAVDRLLPERFSEPDAESFDVQSAPARRQEMAQLVDDDEEIKKENDLEKDENDAQDMNEHKLYFLDTNSPILLIRGEFRRFLPGPLIGAQYGTEIG